MWFVFAISKKNWIFLILSGFGYIKTLAENFYGVEDVELIKAVGLDIYEVDASAIINEALAQIEKIS